MSNFETELAKINRQPVWVLMLYPDYCANEFGVSPCTAAGAPYCYYTYPTCKDKAHFFKSVKEYLFCEKSGPWLKDMLPYLKSISYNSMELDPKSFKTTRGDLTVTLCDDMPHHLANPDKLSTNIETAGSFWKNWLARNPNYFRRIAELHLVLGEPLLAEQLLYGMSYAITNIIDRLGQTFKGDGVTLRAIEIVARAEYSTDYMECEIWQVSPATGLPVDLLATSLNRVYPAQGQKSKHTFYFNPLVLPDEQVAYALKRSVPAVNNFPSIWGAGNDFYPDGGAVKRWASTGLWEFQPSVDYYFRIYTCYPKLFFRGVIEKVEYKSEEITLTIKDLLKSLDVPSHIKQSDKVVMAEGYAGGNEMRVYCGQELSAYGVVKSSGGKYVKYSGVTGPDFAGAWTLDNCQFAFGSSGLIAPGETVKQVLIYGRDDSGLSDGLPADMILMDLICNRALINPDYIALIDSGAVLSNDISDEDTLITISDGLAVPDQGVIKVGNEFIIYGGKNGNVLDCAGGPSIPIFYYHKRGAFGTTAAGHKSGAKIYIPTITRECLTWLNGMLFRTGIADPIKTQELVNQFCEQALVQAWQNEDGKIEFKAIAPPLPANTVATLDDKTAIIEDSPVVINDPLLQNTRLSVYYNPADKYQPPGTDPSKYANLFMEVNTDIENANYLNTQRPRTIFANWLFREDEVIALASRLLALSSEGILQAKFQVELKDFNIGIGSYVKIDSKQIVDQTGANKVRYFEIISKKPKSIEKFEMAGLEFSFNGIYGLIGPEDPVLKNDIKDSDTTLDLQLADASYQNQHFKDSGGQVRIDNEKIQYDSKSYNAGTKTLTLNNCTRGILGTAPAAHSAGALALLLYTGASQAAKDKWAWIGDASGKLDSDGDGLNETDGYIIW